MYKIYLLSLLSLIIGGCNTNNSISKETLDSITRINIRNDATENFEGLKEFSITDKKEIASFCNELISLKQEINLSTKPFDGTILIRFLRKDKDGLSQYINVLTSGVILKPNGQYFITNSRGQFVSDHFLARVIKYLEIDESKVSALDEYRKSLEEESNKKEK